METLVAGELGMEARGEQSALTCRDDGAVIKACEDFDARPNAADARRADEDRVEWRLAELLHVKVRFERVDLSPERVPFDGHVHERGERVRMAGDLLRDEDRARARAPHGHALGDAVLELVDDAVLARELAGRRAPAPRDDGALGAVERLKSAGVAAFV